MTNYQATYISVSLMQFSIFFSWFSILFFQSWYCAINQYKALTNCYWICT